MKRRIKNGGNKKIKRKDNNQRYNKTTILRIKLFMYGCKMRSRERKKYKRDNSRAGGIVAEESDMCEEKATLRRRECQD